MKLTMQAQGNASIARRHRPLVTQAWHVVFATFLEGDRQQSLFMTMTGEECDYRVRCLYLTGKR